jgi:hypothetical protein
LASRILLSSSLFLLVAACQPNEATIDISSVGEVQGPERISRRDDPNILVPGASARLYDNISWNDVGWTFGVEDAKVPYADTYWPYEQGGIDYDWTGYGSPL